MPALRQWSSFLAPEEVRGQGGQLTAAAVRECAPPPSRGSWSARLTPGSDSARAPAVLSGGPWWTGPTSYSGSVRVRAAPTGGPLSTGPTSCSAARECTPPRAEVPGKDQLPSEVGVDESILSSLPGDDASDRQLSNPDSQFGDPVLSPRYTEHDRMYYSHPDFSTDENFNDFQEIVYAPLHSTRRDASNRAESSGACQIN